MEAGIHELTAGYALDALDPGERSAYEAHLPGCEHCQHELASFWQTTEALAVAASGPAPSAALRERILTDVRAEPPQSVVPLARIEGVERVARGQLVNSVCHDPVSVSSFRSSRRRASPANILLLIVPSGCPSLSASSDWENPP